MSEQIRTSPADPPKREVGQIIDSRYRITGVLGQGGMGQVYAAEHVTIRRPVALKLLHAELRQLPNFNARFAREAFAAGRLRHPNVVAITDSSTLDDGTTYLVMELLEGESLGDLLDRETRVAWPRALHIARHVLRGLAHAHAAGVVHRDIKPENIFVGREGDDPDFAKILDFGIAKLVGDAIVEAGGEQLTQAGFAVGSPTYMSPEQAIGSEIDGRTDLYSLSIVLFELIVGKPPFWSDEKLEVLKMHFQQPAPAASAIAPDAGVPPEVDALLIHGLAKQPEQRIASANDYLARIDALLGGAQAAQAGAATPRPYTPSPPRAPPPPPAALPTTPLPSARAQPAAAPSPQAPQTPVPPPMPARPHSHVAEALAATQALPSGQHPRAAAGVSPRADKRRWLIAAGAAGVVAVLLAAVLSPAGPAPSASDEPGVLDMAPEILSSGVPADVLASRPALAEAERLLHAGKHAAVIDELRAARRDYPDDPHVAYLIGSAYFQRLWWSDGFDAYRDAVSGHPAYREDPTVIHNAIRSLMSRRQHGMGERFLIEEIGDVAIPYLERAQRESQSAGVRERAARVLARLR